MRTVFAPGCAMTLYKPEAIEKLLAIVTEEMGQVDLHQICCHHQPGYSQETLIINTCPGCDKRFRELYDNVITLSLWELLAKSQKFPFPDYHGYPMTILDACPTRQRDNIHIAIRTLLAKMNINLVEPEHTKQHSRCCGDSYFGVHPISHVKEQMLERASAMPVDDVVVYCVSCCVSMHIGGKTPRYLIDLLLGEETVLKTVDPEEWHKMLDDFISRGDCKTI
ncbi:MAG: (Fe-S)-binding protein [bacterium]